MNLFKSSFFSDFTAQDVLASSAQDNPSSSETSMSSDIEEISSADYHGVDTQISSHEVSSDTSHAGTSKQEDQKAGLWGLGGFMKSLTLKSEGILQAYAKDLEEFGSGLKKETQYLAKVAAHAVKDLPTSLETGAHIAQESIESVGQVVEDFSSSVWRGTADLIAQGKDVVLRMDEEEDSAVGPATSSSSVSGYDNVVGGKYSRFEALVRAMQHDSGTYCEEPADMAEYEAWKSTFSLSEKRENIDSLVAENTYFQELLSRFVPELVSEEIFWTRYFYRFYKLQQTEEARADLVKRAISRDEEDLTWDTEEDDDDEGGAVNEEQIIREDPENPEEVVIQHLPAEILPGDLGNQPVENEAAAESLCIPMEDDVGTKDPARATLEDEDGLGWEVAEDVESSSNDGKRSSNSDTSWEVPEVRREELRKRFAAQEHDEDDLSWDVDDVDDDTK